MRVEVHAITLVTVAMLPDYIAIHAWCSGWLSQKIGQISFMICEQSYIHVSKLKVTAFWCEVGYLIVIMWSYQFFDTLESDRQSERNTVLLEKNYHMTSTLKKLHWLPIKQQVNYKLCLLVHKTTVR